MFVDSHPDQAFEATRIYESLREKYWGDDRAHMPAYAPSPSYTTAPAAAQVPAAAQTTTQQDTRPIRCLTSIFKMVNDTDNDGRKSPIYFNEASVVEWLSNQPDIASYGDACTNSRSTRVYALYQRYLAYISPRPTDSLDPSSRPTSATCGETRNVTAPNRWDVPYQSA
jgi:hypothetical protein